ncbi:hypothetical protein L6164_000651 [Bauhinia variegata]|uniref:Uncharacterized protein n=1 Tax=Bauhinia variegata TaxID=167791 RepID=A0ACB9QD12_BAUVA|nr:hypothetical protein L6164_000651 [Bauhinia variegata]
MTDADKALINSMLGHGLKASTTMDFTTGLAGGLDKVGFTRKDLYNYAEKQRKMKVSEGDAHSALNYLQGKADSDPKFFVRHTIDDEGCLENLFWCDGHSQFDYKCFGEVIAFDATYKINKYNKPFVMFTGNNIIFASALLVDESKETYIWVLEKLMEVMQDKKPYAVVTDGDKAMRKAIEVVFPDACHCLCTWHLAKNATSNIHSDKFTQEMSRCIYANVDIETFEAEWKSLIEQFSLSNNKWVEKMYKKHHMWANAYLRKKFFAGIQTTSRCESTNSFFKKYLKSHYNLLEFVQHFERGMKITRYKEGLSHTL